MSYVLHAWDGPIPKTDQESELIFDRLNRLPARPGGKLDDFVARLHARFPAFSTTPDTVWLDGSLDAGPHGPSSCSVTLDLPAADLPDVAWVMTAHGRPWPIGLKAPLQALAGDAGRLPFRDSHGKFIIYRAAHAAELVSMLTGLLRDELLPRLASLHSAPALFAALRTQSPARPWPAGWADHATYLSHLIGSPEADSLLMQEQARLRAWEGDPQADDHPGRSDVETRRDRLDRILAMRQGHVG